MVVPCGSLAGTGLLSIRATLRRRCELAITEPAILTRAIVPELFEEELSLINRLLPPDGRDGNASKEFLGQREPVNKHDDHSAPALVRPTRRRSLRSDRSIGDDRDMTFAA